MCGFDDDVARCVEKLFLESVALVAALALVRVLMYPQEEPVGWSRVLVFVALYMGFGLVFKACNFEFSDRISSIAGIELGMKLFKAL